MKDVTIKLSPSGAQRLEEDARELKITKRSLLDYLILEWHTGDKRIPPTKLKKLQRTNPCREQVSSRLRWAWVKEDVLTELSKCPLTVEELVEITGHSEGTISVLMRPRNQERHGYHLRVDSAGKIHYKPTKKIIRRKKKS